MSENSKRKKYNLEIPDDVMDEIGDEYNDIHPTFTTVTLAVVKLHQANELLRVQDHQLFKVKDAYDRSCNDLVKSNLRKYEESLVTLNNSARDEIQTEITYLSQLISLGGTPEVVTKQ